MAVKNNKGVFIEGHNDNHGTSHMNFYDRNPRIKPHESYHININSDGSGTIVEKRPGEKKETTHIDLKK